MVDNNSDNKVENTTSNSSGKDITNEVEVDEDEVEIFSIEELVPNSTPITVPYLELYRTNELEYVPYFSPYNVGIQSSSSDTGGSETPPDTSESGDSGSDNSENNSNNSSNSSSSGSEGTVSQ